MTTRRWRQLAAAAMSAAGLALAGSAAAQALVPQPVQLPSLDQAGGAAVLLPAYWFNGRRAGEETPPDTARPALVLLHGCGGVFGRGPELAQRYTELAERLAKLGVQALVVDSLTPRGESELCTQPVGQRQTTQAQRRRDALGALQWLAAQPSVDPRRIGLLGWSNGGSTVLAATNLAHPEVARAPVRPSLAVAFYPGCATERDRGYRPAAPLLMLLGEADDWTPAAPCKDLAARVSGEPRPQWVAYADAHHGFDGTAAVRFRADVPNGAPGRGGVHVGGQPLARSLAAQRLQDFLQEQWHVVASAATPAATATAATATATVSTPMPTESRTEPPNKTPQTRTGP